MNSHRRSVRRALRWPLVVITLFIALSSAPVVAASSTAAASLVVPELLTRVPGSRTMYVVDLVGCQQLQCLRLYRTSVSATNFIAVSLPPLSEVAGILTGDLNRLVFATSNVGYALVGSSEPLTLYKTMDGARTWHRVTIASGRSIVGLSVSAPSIYTVTANCSSSGAKCGDYQLNRSTLNATKWTSSAIPHTPKSQVFDGNFSPNVGAFANEVWISEITHAGSTIFKSHDQGKTFTPLAANKLGSVSGCALTAASATSLWAACPTGMDVSFFHSSDGGATWSIIPSKQFSGTGGGAFDPVSAGLAYLAYGEQGPLDRINSAGRSVTVVGRMVCSSLYSSLEYLSFTDATHGLVLCFPGGSWKGERLLRTSDGGVHWTRAPAN